MTDQEAPELWTVRLHLRPWKTEDLDTFLAYKTDPANWRHIGGRSPTRRRARLVLAEFQQEWKQDGIGRWAIELRATGKLIGDCGVIVGKRGPEPAYMVASPHWGCGYATEAAGAVIEYVLVEYGWPEISASAHLRNAASRRVLEKLGMVLKDTESTPNGIECWYALARP